MRRFAFLSAFLVFVLSAQVLRLTVRPEGTRDLDLHHTAIIVCDMWNNHWCSGAAKRVSEMAPRMDAVLAKARAAGIPIIHAPSEVMDFYRDYPQRQAMLAFANTPLPATIEHADPPLPIDDKSGGCETHDQFFKAWTREHPALTIGPNDRISDSGREVYGYLKLNGITDLLVMGVHANMCILNRTFAIKQMTRWGMRCLLVRDLTDAMYDPNDAPHVSHKDGTELVIQHIERNWAPSITSADFVAALANQKQP